MEIGRKNQLSGLLFAVLSVVLTTNDSRSAKKQKYYFMVFSNPVTGKDSTYLQWCKGQHIHDLLGIPGFVAAQFFKLPNAQFSATPPQRYLMIWEIETDNLQAVFADVSARLKDGRAVFTDALDTTTYASTTMSPMTRRITADEVKGKSVAEVGAIARGR